MELRFRRPGPPLSAFVEKIWSFQGYQPKHALERIMPDGSAEMVFNLQSDRSRLYDRRDTSRVQTFPGCILCGPQSEYNVIDTEEQCSTLGVHFRPGGIYPFFGLPADELHGYHVGLDMLWGPFARELRDRLLATPTVEARLGLLEWALLERVSKPLALHPGVRHALAMLQHGPRTQTISEVTDQVGLSARRFIEVFKQQVGLTPKLFCRVRRFQAAVQRIAAGGRVEWADVALDCGYFDQAHFINDFRAFSGLSPTTYAEMPVRHPNHVPLVSETV